MSRLGAALPRLGPVGRAPGPALRAALREDAKLAQPLYPLVLVAVERRLNATRVQLLDLFAAKEVRTW